MNVFETEKGTTLHWKVSYRLGGMNYFTNNEMKRGYVLHLQRSPSLFLAFTGIDQKDGATSMLIHEVKRRSKKQEQVAMAMVTPEFLQDIANRFGI